MKRATFLASAQDDLLSIFDYITDESGSATVARQFVGSLRTKCHQLAGYGTTVGRPRRDIRCDLRSVPFGSYVILFRYRSDVFEVVNIIERHRDVDTHGGQTEDT